MGRASGKYHIAAGLDTGSLATRCVVCAVDNGRMRFLGCGEVPSAGWLKGRIADPLALSATIQAAIHEAERTAQVPVESIVAGMAGASIEGGHNHGIYECGRTARPITQSELSFAADRASRVRLEDDRSLLHVFPQDFTVDGRSGYRNPRGLTCSRLEANVYILTVAQQEHDALITAIHNAQVAVDDTVFEPFAAAYAAVMPPDRARGVAVLDIGLHTSDFIVYDGDAVVLALSLSIGGDHFTRDAVHRLTVSYEDAERLKIEYGCAILGLTADNCVIEIPSIESRGPREAPRKYLNDVLDARAEELFEVLREELTRAGMEKSLFEGIVLTGGGALLNGMCDMAERVLNCPARNGLAQGIQGWPEALDNPVWTTAAGLAMYSGRLNTFLKTRRDLRPKAPGLVGLILR